MPDKIYLFVGVQGSGKGTQAKIVSKEKNYCHISTGDLFRSLSGELKEKVDEFINSGKLVPDSVVIEMVKERLSKSDCEAGVILDGFPRNLSQAKELDKEFKVLAVFEIKISDEESLKRLSGRVTCSSCGEGFNLITQPKPLNPNICDKCGGKLVQRQDDTPLAIKKRIEDYHKETFPILENYKDRLIVIEGQRDIEEITKDILEKIN